MTMPWRPSEECYGTGQSFLWRKTNKCDIKEAWEFVERLLVVAAPSTVNVSVRLDQK